MDTFTMSPYVTPSATPVGEYRLGRTYLSSSRLNLQQFLWKETVGHNLHPSIPVKNGESITIADIGTGTGIWLFDLSRENASAQLHGFDISLAQCPPPEWLPSNVSIRKLDIYESLPEELVGQYDVVHVRLFLCVIKNNDPVPVLTNLLKMLKPGGYIQWSEHNLGAIELITARPGLQTQATEKLLQSVRDSGLGKWAHRLSAIFAEQGVLESRTYYYPTSPHASFFFTQVQLFVSEEYSWTTLDNSSPQATGPQRRTLLQEVAKEVQEGAGLKFVLEVTTGRKAW